jgi:hypothetical protein
MGRNRHRPVRNQRFTTFYAQALASGPALSQSSIGGRLEATPRSNMSKKSGPAIRLTWGLDHLSPFTRVSVRTGNAMSTINITCKNLGMRAISRRAAAKRAKDKSVPCIYHLWNCGTCVKRLRD